MKSDIKKVLTIAGSDSGGGAGIQADIKTISACGCYAMSAITAITAQNTQGVQAVEPLSLNIIEKQIRAVLDDIGANAVKIGMLATAEIVRLVAALLQEYKPKYIVLDPVLVATSGDRLTKDSATEAILRELMPIATVITPNIPEAEQLTGLSIQDEADFRRIWETLTNQGAQAVLIKGGHLETSPLTDVLFTPEEAYSYTHDRILTRNTHGTGCSLSSAIASFLALGYTLPEAVQRGTDYIHAAIRAAVDQKIGQGSGPVHHFHEWWK